MATLYFNGAIDDDWNNLDNWWTDSNYSIAATNLPTNNDDVIISATIAVNNGSNPTVTNMTMNGDNLFGIVISVTNLCTFNESSWNYSGTINGNCVFNNSSRNSGTINGNATFTASSFSNDPTGTENGTITGTITFSSLTPVTFTINGGWFTNSSGWIFSTPGQNWILNNYYLAQTGTINGDCTFNNDSYNDSGTITGNVTFTSNNYDRDPTGTFVGSIGGTITFNSSTPVTFTPFIWDTNTVNWIFSTPGQNWVFNSNAYNNGTIYGNCSFNNASTGEGTIVGNCIFNGNSYNSGSITGNCVFNNTSSNRASIAGDCIFNGDSYLDEGTITGNCIFNDTSRHDNIGSIIGNCIFNDNSYLFAPVDGNCIFNNNAIFKGDTNGNIVSGSITFNNNSKNITNITADNIIVNRKIVGIANSDILGMSYPNPTTLLLHFDGANNSTTFTDSSINSISITAHGGAVISTARSQFGSGSLHLPTAGDHLVTGASDGFAFNTGDFTVEFWCWVPSNGVGGVTPYTADGTGGRPIWGTWVYKDSGQWKLIFDVPGVIGVFRNVTITDETWHHVAFSRQGGSLRFFLDGVQAGSAESLANNLGTTSGAILVGFTTGAGFAGYIDELSVVKGAALHTANFTPPTAPY